MALHIILGFDGNAASAKPTVVYAGRSKTEADAARAADKTSVCFECFQNARGYRKNNPNFTPPPAPVAEPAAAAAESTDKPATTAGRHRR